MESLKEEAIVIYDDLADMYFEEDDGEPYYHYQWAEEDFENTFEDFEGEFVICGSVGLWDGRREGYSTKLCNSIMEAIVECNNGFYGNVRVSEEDGELLVDISHHDGSNALVIRELTDLGREMWNDYYEVGDILNVDDATQKVYFRKRKRLSELDATIKYAKSRISDAEDIEDRDMWRVYLKNAVEEKQKIESQD